MFATLSLQSVSHLCMAYEPPYMSTAQRAEKARQEQIAKAQTQKRLMEIRQEEIMAMARKLFFENEINLSAQSSEGRVEIGSKIDRRHMWAARDLMKEAGYAVDVFDGIYDWWWLHIQPYR